MKIKTLLRKTFDIIIGKEKEYTLTNILKKIINGRNKIMKKNSTDTVNINYCFIYWLSEEGRRDSQSVSSNRKNCCRNRREDTGNCTFCRGRG
jgi:hypothetical protein